MNTCEHGDHEAPDGWRFCSDACRDCEANSVGDEGCDGICGRCLNCSTPIIANRVGADCKASSQRAEARIRADERAATESDIAAALEEDARDRLNVLKARDVAAAAQQWCREILPGVSIAYDGQPSTLASAPSGIARPLLDVLRELTPQQAATLGEMLDDRTMNAALLREALGNAEHRYYVSGEGWVDSLRIVELADEIQGAAPSGLDESRPAPSATVSKTLDAGWFAAYPGKQSWHPTEERAIAATHLYYSEHVAPAVAAATRELRAERDRLQDDHKGNCWSVGKVDGWSEPSFHPLGNAIMALLRSLRAASTESWIGAPPNKSDERDPDDEEGDDEEEQLCDDCGGPAMGPDDAHCVNCDCGAVVCSACCEAFDGESYCAECAGDKYRAACPHLHRDDQSCTDCGDGSGMSAAGWLAARTKTAAPKEGT